MRETMRSYKIPLLRVLSLVLAVMTTVTLTAVPSLDLQAVQTAQAATATVAPTIRFSNVSKDNWNSPNDNTTATVVTGESITLDEIIPSGLGAQSAQLVFTSTDESLTLTADTTSTSDTEVAGGSVVIGTKKSDNTRTLTFRGNFNPEAPNAGNGNQSTPASTIYRISGAYQSTRSEGLVSESGGGTKPVTVLDPENKNQTGGATVIGENNTLKFTLQEDETILNQNPSIKIDTATGSLKKYDSGKVEIWRDNGWQAARTDIREGNVPQRTVVFLVTKSGGGDEMYLRMRVDSIHEDHTEPDPKDPTKEIQYYNNYIKDGTTFEVSFTAPVSQKPDISLNIVTPQTVMRNIETEIETVQKEEGSTNFIAYANIPDEDVEDEREWVTRDILVRSKLKRHNASFDIKWVWVPDDSSAEDVVKEGVNPQATDMKNWPSVPASERTDWLIMQVKNNTENTVEGDLVPVVYYSDLRSSTSTETDLSKLPRIHLKIPGTKGADPYVEEVYEENGRRNGNSNTTQVLLGNAPVLGTKEIPSEKEMDAYKGDISGWNPFDFFSSPTSPNPPPFKYILELDLGSDAKAAEYITITPSGSGPNYDPKAVSFKVDPSGGYNFTAPERSEIRPTALGTGPNRKIRVEFTAADIPYTDPLTQKTVTYTIEFKHTRGGSPRNVEGSTRVIDFTVTHTLPDPESRLEKLLVTAYGEKISKIGENIDFGFVKSTEKDKYTERKEYDVELPYRATSITINPTFMKPQKLHGVNAYMVIQDYRTGELKKNSLNYLSDSGRIPIKSSNPSEEISFADSGDIDKTYKITITTPSQDPRNESTYILNVTRNNASDVSTLNGLGIYPYEEEGDSKDNETPERNYIKNFDPNTLNYDIIVPYSTDILKFRGTKGNDQQKNLELVPPFKLETMGWFDTDPCKLKNIKRLFQDSGNLDEDGALVVQVEVVSELGDVTGNKEGHSTIYTIHIFRESPNHDATLAALSVYDKDKNEQRIIPTFNPNTNTYYAEVDYAVEQILLSIDPTYKKPGNIQVYRRKVEPGNLLLDMRDGKDVMDFPDEGPLTFDIGPDNYTPEIPYFPVTGDPAQPYMLDVTKAPGGYELFVIKVIPECEEGGREDDPRNHTRLYNLQVRRKEPSHEARLKSLELKDQANSPIKTFAFHQDEFNYSLTVPYETTGVSFTPTVLEPHAKFVIVDGVEYTTNNPYTGLESGATSKVFQLPERHGVDRTYTVIVTAQDGTPTSQRQYNVTIRRAPPSSDAWLKNLTTDHTENFKPLFVPKNMDYSAEVKAGEPGVTITATANHPAATIKIDGMVVESGVASDLISLLDVKQTVTIEVTAQDGVTKKYYHIEFTNMNLVELTNNADLKNLTVNYGLMTPKFQAAVTEYEVTVKEDTWSVDIIPRLSDDLATVRVLGGTRELGDYRGNYALALVDGENTVTVEVTSPDKTVVKNYNITIYRNDEEKLKNLEPLESEDINWENTTNPILVKIEEYPRVGASVFNTIREEYPEKSIIFQGNDYSIRFDGKNLNRVIPQREIFDFRMTFDSPDEDAIYDLIEEREVNDDILDDVVLCYFDYHGSLPGPATFNLSLGRKYSNETLYWHYYNQERDRIDYYGSLKSNNKGTVAVSIDHFSTYIVSPTHRIAGSEDKDGVIDQLGMVSNGQDLLGSGGKLNPDTGETEGRP